jgi:outer membrane autotransporter protein
MRQAKPMLHALFGIATGLLLATGAGTARAQDLSMPPLPPGTVLTGPIAFQGGGGFIPSITTGAAANAYVGAYPPVLSFVPNAPAAVVLTTAPTQWVRFYTAGAQGDMGSPVGSWIAGTNAVRGLTAEQVKDVLALPSLPTSLAIVRAPAGVCTLAAQGNAVLGNFPADPPNIPTPGPWGRGGTPQYFLIGQANNANCVNALGLPDSAYLVQLDMGTYALAYAPQAGGGNAGAVAQALDQATPPPLFGDMDSVYNALDILNLTDGAALRAALVQLDGEVYADLPTVAITGGQLVLGVLRDQMRIGRTLAGAAPLADPPAVPTGQLRAWVSGFGGAGALSGNGDSHDADFALGGIVGGLDYAVAPGLRVGMALGYGRAGYSLDGLSGNADLDQYTVALHGSLARGAFYLDAAIGYSYMDATVTRDIAFPGVLRSTTGTPQGNALIAGAEIGYHLSVGATTVITPLAGLQAVSLAQGGFTESGAGAVDLQVESQTTSSVRGLLGAELTQRIAAGTGALRATLRLAWAHEFAATGRSIDATFAGLPGAAFTVQGVRAPRDLAVIGVGVSMPVDGLDLFLRYDGNVATDFGVHSGSLGLRVAF